MSQIAHAYVAQMLRKHLPDYAREHIRDASIEWDWLADCAMLSSGEAALVLLAAHIDNRPGIVNLRPAVTFIGLLNEVDRDIMLDVLACLDAVLAANEMVR
jgi:hypothetical protein